MEPTDAHRHEKTAHPPYAPSPKRMRRRDSFEHLEERLHALRDALRAAKQGDFSVRLPTDGAAEGVMDEVALAFNALIEENDALVNELRRVDRSVAFEGKTTERAFLAAGGSWAVAVDSVNSLVEKMAWPVKEATSVLGLVANGDLSRDMSLHMGGTALEGDFRELGTTVKTVVGRLRTVSSGVSRVVREMGTEGSSAVKPASKAFRAPGRISSTT
jgi:methyl-accepting chemotaxis protein